MFGFLAISVPTSKVHFFAAIDELLLQVYFMYKKSPKKCRELESVAEELKACLEPTEMPTRGGSQPVRAYGTLSHIK